MQDFNHISNSYVINLGLYLVEDWAVNTFQTCLSFTYVPVLLWCLLQLLGHVKFLFWIWDFCIKTEDKAA